MKNGFRASLGFVLLSCVAAGAGGGVKVSAGLDLRDLIGQYQEDRGALGRFYELEGSPARVARLRKLSEEWLARLAQVDFDALDLDGRIDYVLLRARSQGQLVDLAREERKASESRHAGAGRAAMRPTANFHCLFGDASFF